MSSSNHLLPPMLLCVALYLMFLSQLPSIIHTQRCTIKRVRAALSTLLGWDKLILLDANGSAWDGNEFGFGILTTLFACILLTLCVTLVSEGLFHAATNLFAISAALLLGVQLKISRSTIVWLARVLISATFYFQIYFWEEIPELHFRRSVVIRVMANLIFFESLGEGLLHLACASVLEQVQDHERATQTNVAYVPLLVYLVCNIPLHVLGFSEWLCISTNRQLGQVRARMFMRNMHFFSMLVALSVLYWAYSAPNTVVFFQLKSLFCFACAFGLRLTRLGKMVDNWLAPNVVFDAASTTVPCDMVFGTFSVEFLQTFRRTCKHPATSIFILGLAFWRYNLALVFMMTLRIVRISIENRPFSVVQSETFLLLGILLLLVEAEWVAQLCVTLGYIAMFASLLITTSRELGIAKVKEEREGSNFLSHAIKQKYAAVGASVELVDRTPGTDLALLLNRVADECQKGHDRCHATNLYRTLKQTGAAGSDGNAKRENKRYFGELKTFLRNRALIDVLEEDVDDRFQDANVYLDWEVFGLCLAEWVRGGNGKLTSCTVTRTKLGLADIRLSMSRVSINRNFAQLLIGLAAELDGWFEGNDFVLANIAIQSSSKMVLPRRLESEYTVLSKLRFAILDDNKLVRKNCENILIKTLGVRPENILSCGATLEEAKFFSIQLGQQQNDDDDSRGVDICIFDQCLDYDNVVLNGADIALECRRRGFTGCSVLHTSAVDIHTTLARNKVFYGAIEKSADKSHFIQGLLNAWYTYQRARKL